MTTFRQNPLDTMIKLYLDRNETGDIKFTIEGDVIAAHRCVLAAFCPPEYEEKFYDSKSNEVFDLTNVSVAAFEEFLQFYYLQQFLLTIENIETVLYLAQQSHVESFVNKCVSFLVKKLTIENVCMIYRLAITYEIKDLKILCEYKISSNTKNLFNTEDFLNCNIQVLLQILKLDTLDCSETDIFNSCIVWAQNSCRKKNIDIDDIENLRAELGDAFNEIRFGTMNHDEYAEIHKSYNKLFSTEEFTEILYMIGKLDGFKSKQFKQKPRRKWIQMSASKRVNIMLLEKRMEDDIL